MSCEEYCILYESFELYLMYYFFLIDYYKNKNIN